MSSNNTIEQEFPLVTCTMVTEGRYDLIKKSIDCFINQTYPNKNLVIVLQGDNESIENYVNELGRSDILLISCDPKSSLGAMRNLSVELALGNIICQWDDDDLYLPTRIRSQYESLISEPNIVASLYSNFIKYFKNTKELYWCDWSKEAKPKGQVLTGSVMFWKKYFYDFKIFYPQEGNQSGKEEDLNVLLKLLSKGKVAHVTSGHEYVYVFHGKNTYNLTHHNYTLDTHSGKIIKSIDELIDAQSVLTDVLETLNFNEEVIVRSLDGEAFRYIPCAE